MNDAGTRTQGLTSRLGAQTVAAGSHCESGNCPDHTGRALSQSVQDGGGTEFGRLLAGFRSSYGLSQEELAERSGMSVRAIRDLERGKVERPRRASVALLANALALTGADREVFRDAAANLPELIRFRREPRQSVERIMPCQLPPDISDFTGRELALERVHSLVRSREHESTAVMIAVVCGKAGAGKTTLAIHAAHKLRALFTDGQLYVNLHGAQAQALDPAHVLSRFLRAFAVDECSIPDDVDERAGLYRSLMADRRVLVLLDNAVDEAQVRPLLPGGAGNLVLVTSRTQLTGLAVAERIHLGALPSKQAVELLAKIAGADRVAREPDAAAAIAALCGHLPLALRMAGGRLAAKPRWRLQRPADRLGGRDWRLGALTMGDMEVRENTEMHYQRLHEAERQASHPLEVPDLAACMLAALLDTSIDGAWEIADRLTDDPLLGTARDVARQFHDLLRRRAGEWLTAVETPGAPHTALAATRPGVKPDLAEGAG